MFAALLALAVPALATIYTTSPVAHTQAYGGQVLHIDWVDDGEAPNLPDIGPCSIDLCIGSESDQRCIQNLGESVDVSAASSIETTIDPSVGENGKYYFIRYRSHSLMDGDGSFPYQQYSARFQLNSMEGNFDDQVKALVTSSSDDFLAASRTSSAASDGASDTASASATGGDASASAAASASASGEASAGASASAASGSGVASASAVPAVTGSSSASATTSSSSSTQATTAARTAAASASPSPSADSGVAKFAAPGLFTVAACIAAYIAI